MNKYFIKEESENIITLLKSKDKESICLGFSLIKTHPKFKNFKKLIPYNESRILLYGKYRIGCFRKNNVLEEIKSLQKWFIEDLELTDFSSFHREIKYLLRFIEKRTK